MKSSSKAAILIIGIFIGIIAGIALATWMDYMGYELNPLKKISYLFSHRNGSGEKDLLVFNQKGSLPEDQEDQNAIQQHSRFNRDSAGFVTQQGADKRETYEDSALMSDQPREQIKLATDQLIGSKVIRVDGLLPEKTANLDSILIDDKFTGRQNETVKVELWYSPINYTGYKWSNNKLVLFGFYDPDMVKIKYLDHTYYLKYGTLYYRITPTVSFTNLELTEDAALIKKLNSL